MNLKDGEAEFTGIQFLGDGKSFLIHLQHRTQDPGVRAVPSTADEILVSGLSIPHSRRSGTDARVSRPGRLRACLSCSPRARPPGGTRALVRRGGHILPLSEQRRRTCRSGRTSSSSARARSVAGRRSSPGRTGSAGSWSSSAASSGWAPRPGPRGSSAPRAARPRPWRSGAGRSTSTVARPASYGTDSGFRELGYLILAVTDDDERAGRERVEMQRANGLDVTWLDAAEAARTAGTLSPDGHRGGSYLADRRCHRPAAQRPGVLAGDAGDRCRSSASAPPSPGCAPSGRQRADNA